MRDWSKQITRYNQRQGLSEEIPQAMHGPPSDTPTFSAFFVVNTCIDTPVHIKLLELNVLNKLARFYTAKRIALTLKSVVGK